MKQEELIYKYGIYEQQIRQLQEQMHAVEQGIMDLEMLGSGLEELKEGQGREILAPIGRGIFVKSKVIDEKLTVDIGGGNFVKKDIDETKQILNKQIEKLKNVKDELNNAMENMSEELEKLMKEVNISD
ncbi:MAG: prefoldin subunit alpha [Nanoarchaeota archaeon]